MKIPKWICNKCEQTFTRRWNAKRHCNNLHDGVLDFVIYFRDYLRQTAYSPLSQIPHGPFTMGINQLPYQETPSIQSKHLNPYARSLSHNSKTNLTNDNLLYVTMNDIATRYEE